MGDKTRKHINLVGSASASAALMGSTRRKKQAKSRAMSRKAGAVQTKTRKSARSSR